MARLGGGLGHRELEPDRAVDVADGQPATPAKLSNRTGLASILKAEFNAKTPRGRDAGAEKCGGGRARTRPPGG
jgi:hypothetical protein